MSNNQEGFKDSKSLTQWVRYMLYAQVIVAVISIISGYLEYELLSDYKNGVYTSQAKAVADGKSSDQRQEIAAIANIIVFVVSDIFILRWIHRKNYNARQLGAENMKFTPRWSIGYYFIPILALWKPYQAMKEIWKASKSPSDWDSQDTSGILPLWWTLWLTSNIVGQIAFSSTTHSADIQELINLNVINQISNVLDIPLALVFLSIVNRIYTMQRGHLPTANNQIQSTVESDG